MLLQAAAEVLFTFADARIPESSSLVSSPAGDWLWTANDSGDATRLFAVGPTGRTVTVATLPGTRLVDLEDAAYGPDRTLYLADIGDNAGNRHSVTVLRIPEPAVGSATVTTAPPSRATLTYEDGPHDAETLLLHPRTRQLLVVSKGGTVYAAPRPLTDGFLRRVGIIPVRATGTPGGPRPGLAAQLLATGGAVSPDGRRVVVRTYTDAYVWQLAGDDLVAALQSPLQVFPLPAPDQGEAVTWTRDGTALLTSSEGRSAPVHRVPVPAGPTAVCRLGLRLCRLGPRPTRGQPKGPAPRRRPPTRGPSVASGSSPGSAS